MRGRLLSALVPLFLTTAGALALAQDNNGRSDLGPVDLGLTSVFSAAAQNQTGDVERMLRLGDNPNGVDGTGRSPLGYAALYGNTEMTKALLAGGEQHADGFDLVGVGRHH